MTAGIYVDKISLSDGTEIKLKSNSIVVITGPNNSGKTSVLRELNKAFDRVNRKARVSGPVLKTIHSNVKGKPESIIDLLKNKYEYDPEEKRIKLSYNHSYLLQTIINSFNKNKLPSPIEAEFITYLAASNRLGGQYSDRVENAADYLYDNEPEEIRISEVYRRAFKDDLILGRSRKGGTFYVGDRSELPSHEERLKPEYAKKLKQKPTVRQQGDGIRSFVRIALELLVDPKSIIGDWPLGKPK